MTEAPAPKLFHSVVKQLVADLDTCRRSGADPARVADLEHQLAALIPTTEIDFFALCRCLADGRLSAASRERIGANIAKAAPLIHSRRVRVDRWLEKREDGLSGSKGALVGAMGCVVKAMGLTNFARTTLQAPGCSVGERAVATGVLDAGLSELTGAKALVEMADYQLRAPEDELPAIAEEVRGEYAVWAESIGKTAH